MCSSAVCGIYFTTETAVDDNKVISYAKTDIEEQIAIAGTDPLDEAEMLADNYAVQWETLAMLGEVSRRLELELAQSAV
jgi:hypothetical protein